MTHPPITIEPGAPVRAAAALMVERQVNRLPVVEDGRLVGIVTRADVVRTFVRSDAELEREIVEGVILRAMWLDPPTSRGSGQGRGRPGRRPSRPPVRRPDPRGADPPGRGGRRRRGGRRMERRRCAAPAAARR
ncbi:MAG: hypothetical protein C4343_07160, partial [Chloroflexota bacterium]